MKKLVAITLLTGALGAASLQAQDFRAPATHRRSYAPINPSERTEGSLQRGVRLGNPAQMINPFAPAEYGSGQEFVQPRQYHEQALRPHDRSREFPIGLRFFSIAF